VRVGLYARVSTHDQKTLPLQLTAMCDYIAKRGWKTAVEIQEVGSGAILRPKREELLKAARRRELDRIVVWRLDRWGRSLLDLIATLQELASLGVGFVSLSEALDLTTPSGRALAGMLAIFAEFERDILRDRVKAGIAQARKEGRPHGRPPTVAKYVQQVRSLAQKVRAGPPSARSLLSLTEGMEMDHRSLTRQETRIVEILYDDWQDLLRCTAIDQGWSARASRSRTPAGFGLPSFLLATRRPTR
jgi:putative DNA-invertase from lambdoid prophage Rac